jgi:glycosyltransferase involved in cell wall biosynthesis/protein-L-isoaspartate O-methyltransferase
MSSIITYYDNFAQRLLADYLRGNPRTEQALDFALASLPGGRMRVLDVGCGIGWSSSEIARNYPQAEILAVDLSPRLVATARSAFGEETRIRFEVKDFIQEQIEGSFDAIVLLDVYEHFPAVARPVVHERLKNLLVEESRLILTVPTPSYQRYLPQRDPEGFQPADEDVTSDDVRALADDLGGRVLVQRGVSIWRSNDYMQVLIERGPPRGAAPPRTRLEDRRERAARIRRHLGIRWTDAAGFVAAHEGPPVCIAVGSLDVVSETFIRAHIERLPTYVHIWQGSPPGRTHRGRSLLVLPLRAAARVVARAFETEPKRVEDLLFGRLPTAARARLYSRYLRRHGIQVVMAEYGSLAIDLLTGCRRAGVPLVSHFHGFDAFHEDVTTRYGPKYRELFQAGWPVVVVSKSMRRQLIALGAKEDQVYLNYYGVDLNEFQPGERVPGLVAAVGRFVDKKAPELTLLAFSKTLQRVPQAQLVMIGDGPLRPAIERLIPALGLESSVSIQGAKGHADVAKLMRKASVFVQHSVTAPSGDREGTPVAVLEAGAAGIPVVATRHEGIAEVVMDGVTGILVDEGDTDAMGAAVAELLLDPSRAEQLGQAARRRVEDNYSIDLSTERLWTILKGAIPT